MTTSVYRGSAKIYQFPARARAAPEGQTASDDRAAPNLNARRVAAAACGSAWYHEAAIQEAEQPGK